MAKPKTETCDWDPGVGFVYDESLWAHALPVAVRIDMNEYELLIESVSVTVDDPSIHDGKITKSQMVVTRWKPGHLTPELDGTDH